ncbi:MAG: hypothetical protein LBJ02_12405 [Bifidobacteriaceae bacterium]|jgi:hypothetical protein|nr:hypothetical protein [Bifidobacteriaceae bacterium]
MRTLPARLEFSVYAWSSQAEAGGDQGYAIVASSQGWKWSVNPQDWEYRLLRDVELGDRNGPSWVFYSHPGHQWGDLVAIKRPMAGDLTGRGADEVRLCVAPSGTLRGAEAVAFAIWAADELTVWKHGDQRTRDLPQIHWSGETIPVEPAEPDLLAGLVDAIGQRKGFAVICLPAEAPSRLAALVASLPPKMAAVLPLLSYAPRADAGPPGWLTMADRAGQIREGPITDQGIIAFDLATRAIYPPQAPDSPGRRFEESIARLGKGWAAGEMRARDVAGLLLEVETMVRRSGPVCEWLPEEVIDAVIKDDQLSEARLHELALDMCDRSLRGGLDLGQLRPLPRGPGGALIIEELKRILSADLSGENWSHADVAWEVLSGLGAHPATLAPEVAAVLSERDSAPGRPPLGAFMMDDPGARRFTARVLLAAENSEAEDWMSWGSVAWRRNVLLAGSSLLRQRFLGHVLRLGAGQVSSRDPEEALEIIRWCFAEFPGDLVRMAESRQEVAPADVSAEPAVKGADRRDFHGWDANTGGGPGALGHAVDVAPMVRPSANHPYWHDSLKPAAGGSLGKPALPTSTDGPASDPGSMPEPPGVMTARGWLIALIALITTIVFGIGVLTGQALKEAQRASVHQVPGLNSSSAGPADGQRSLAGFEPTTHWPQVVGVEPTAESVSQGDCLKAGIPSHGCSPAYK